MDSIKWNAKVNEDVKSYSQAVDAESVQTQKILRDPVALIVFVVTNSTRV